MPPGRYPLLHMVVSFEQLKRARTRLMIRRPPLPLVLIFLLLYANLWETCWTPFRVFHRSAVPPGSAGIFALWLRDMPFLDLGGNRIHRTVGSGCPG